MFTFRKLSLEFDWLRLWTSDRGKKPRKDASAKSQAAEASQFREWIEATRANSTRVFDVGTRRYVKRIDLEPDELERREQWNRENRRVVDLRPVTDREGAAFEVLKYITKVSAFSDLPDAVEEFSNAVRGARLIQTFGTWYNVKLDGDANEHDWSELQCACGMNAWKRMGTFHHADVEMDASGRWHLKKRFDCDSKPTIKHPLIEAMARAAPKGKWEQTTFLVG